jgi:AcrR family transcriptional regulator
VTKADPPYLRIVDEVRQRIASGELRPGDRVPSARRITQDWGVAIATATKVLATLHQEGLTMVLPGVGTVVAGTALPAAAPRQTGRRGADRNADQELTRERIVRAAIDVADAEGMAELSMRRIAAELGVATMSLYRHVPGKDDLVLEMIDAALGEHRLPAVPPEGWRARLELCARLQWGLFRRHPWLAPAMSLTRPQLAPNALAHTEWVLNAFDDTELELGDRMYVHIMVFSYVRGVATAFEPEAEAERETGMNNDEWMDTQGVALDALVVSGALATFLRLARRTDFDFDLHKLFEFGLARLLDGLGVFIRDAQNPTR